MVMVIFIMLVCIHCIGVVVHVAFAFVDCQLVSFMLHADGSMQDTKLDKKRSAKQKRSNPNPANRKTKARLFFCNPNGGCECKPRYGYKQEILSTYNRRAFWLYRSMGGLWCFILRVSRSQDWTNEPSYHSLEMCIQGIVAICITISNKTMSSCNTT